MFNIDIELVFNRNCQIQLVDFDARFNSSKPLRKEFRAVKSLLHSLANRTWRIMKSTISRIRDRVRIQQCVPKKRLPFDVNVSATRSNLKVLITRAKARVINSLRFFFRASGHSTFWPIVANLSGLRWLPTVAGQIYIDQCGASPTGKCFEMNDTWKVVFWGFSTAKSPSVLDMIKNLWNLNSKYVFNCFFLFSDRVFVTFYV